MRSDTPFQIAFNTATVTKGAPKSGSRLTLRFTADEMDRLKAAAGAMALSAYIRKCLFSGSTSSRKGSQRRPVADQQALGRLLGRLGETGIAPNLARLANDARMGCLVLNEPTETQIREACAQVRAMRDDLVAALGLIETRSS